MRKTIPALLLILALLTVLVCPAASAESAGKYQAVIDDAAGLLKSGEEAKVLAAMQPIADEFCNVGFVTYSGSDSSTTVVNKARSWGNKTFGPSADFTVFMIDMATRRLGIYASTYVYKTINTGRANTITDNVYKYATNGKYGDCAVSTFEQITRLLRGQKINAPMQLVSNILLAVILAIIATYILVSSRMKQEQEVSLPDVVTVAGAGAATIVAAHILTKKVTAPKSSGGHGGGGHGGGGGGGGGGGSHGF